MKIGRAMTDFAVERPKTLAALMLGATLLLGLLGGLPTIWPRTFSMLSPLKVDTDPENMLPADEPVRVFHNRMKREMDLHDMVVVGVVNREHPEGVFNPGSLGRIYELARFARTLKWEDPENPGRKRGVVTMDMIAPSMVDSVESGGAGEVRFEWLMPEPPTTQEQAVEVRRRARRVPFLDGTLVSEDGQAIALYLPITSKDLSSRVYDRLKDKIAELGGPEEYHITGLPVAEDVFGAQMFRQMAISAPLAMLIIFILMWIFFRKPILVVSAMFDAGIATVCTMGLLIATGQTVHIMSSMIPIFIVPIAVLDDVHVLSEFFDRYQEVGDRRETMRQVMGSLFVPMLYTSLTTAVGFASLALAPIPPVQVFGLFVAFGVMVAWACSVMFVPAFVMFIPESAFENFGTRHHEGEEHLTVLGRFLRVVGGWTYRHARLILLLEAVAVVVSVYGIKLIRINDNPTKWFDEDHPIRVADRVLNARFGGSYMAYLAFRPPGERGADKAPERPSEGAETAPGPGAETPDTDEEPDLPGGLGGVGEEPALPGGLGDELAAELERPAEPAPEPAAEEIFKRPDVLMYMERLQSHLREALPGRVGKSNGVTDIVKVVHREWMREKLGAEAAFSIPNPGLEAYESPRQAQNAVAQCLLQFQSGHRPGDLWHFVTPDYRQGVLWVQLKSGDNRDMSAVAREVDRYVEENPLPAGLQHDWFGLTYINVVWQKKMVEGMLKAFLGSFLCVFLMMTLLYRSALWGVLCMVPLTVTIGLIYGIVGLVGKDYDMPVAVLSSLSLGLAVDYAIHFLTRTRFMYVEHGSWEDTAGPVFGEPARAISRNAIVVGVGFLPLLAAPLVPYQTVGIFIASILFAAGLATLLILPALITLLEKRLFPRTRACCLACNCITCIASAVAGVALVAVNVQQFLQVGWTTLTWVSIPAIIVLAGACALLSRREKCTTETFVPRERGKQ